jgi:hypothetical protein
LTTEKPVMAARSKLSLANDGFSAKVAVAAAAANCMALRRLINGD